MNYEWYQLEPFCRKRYDSPEHDYDIPAIIEEVKRMEREREYHIYCNQCGLSASFSPNDE